NRYALSGEEARAVGREQYGEADEFFGVTEAAHGGSHEKFFAARGAVDQFAVRVCGEDAGGDGVDRDSVFGPFDGEAAGEGEDSCFCGAVGGYFCEGYVGTQRGDVDDTATAACFEGRVKGLAGAQGSGEADVEDAIPFLFGDVFDWGFEGLACCVQKN